MAQEVTAGALAFVDRLPKDLLDPDVRDRVRRFTERIGEAMRIGDDGRAVVDRAGLEQLVGDRDLFAPSVSEALKSRLERLDAKELVDERGEVRPLGREDIDRLPDEVTVDSIDRLLADLDSRFEGIGSLEIPTIEDGPQPTEDPPEPIPADEVPDRIDRFLECLKDDAGALALALVVASLGVLLAVVGVFCPPVEVAAGWIIAVYGAVVGAYVIHCLTVAGFLRES